MLYLLFKTVTDLLRSKNICIIVRPFISRGKCCIHIKAGFYNFWR